MVIAHKFVVRLFEETAGELFSDPGVAYAEFSANIRAKIDFSKIQAFESRIVVTAQGNEVNDPTTKGIEIYNQTGGAQLCQVEWLGNALQQALAGSWTATTISADSELRIRVKGSSATEDITIYAVDLEVQYE